MVERWPTLFLIFPTTNDGLETVLRNLANTVTNCEDEVKSGYYYNGNTFLFMSDKVRI